MSGKTPYQGAWSLALGLRVLIGPMGLLGVGAWNIQEIETWQNVV